MSCKRQSNSSSLNNIPLPPPKKKTKTKTKTETKKSVSVFYCNVKPHVAGQNQMEALLKTNCWFFNAKWTRSGCNEVVSGVGVE